VALWGDSRAIADKSKAWGGFFSARANYQDFQKPDYAPYVPEGLNLDYGEEFDAQLIGIEVDVLNEAKPGVWPNMSKVGVQIVGFANPNSMAIEVRCEDTDRDVPQRRGVFESALYVKNSLADYGRMIVADFQKAKIGIDFRQPLFSEGAIALRSEQIGTGIVYNNGRSGELYGGRRWPGFEDERNWLSMRAGTGGVRVVSHDNTKELLAIDNHGGIYLWGDLYLNDKKATIGALQASVAAAPHAWVQWVVFALMAALICAMAVALARLSGRIRVIEARTGTAT
jgi:hypothetical protein